MGHWTLDYGQGLLLQHAAGRTSKRAGHEWFVLSSDPIHLHNEAYPEVTDSDVWRGRERSCVRGWPWSCDSPASTSGIGVRMYTYACGTSTVRGLVVIPNRPPRLAQIERCANEGFPNIRELSGSTREETASRPESTRAQAW